MKHYKAIYKILVLFILVLSCGASLSPAEETKDATSALQERFDQLMVKRNAFLEQHDKTKRIPALKVIGTNLKKCPLHTTIPSTAECQALQYELAILTMSYCHSLSKDEKAQLASFAKERTEILKQADEQKIELKKQDDILGLLLI